jgi:hypothetical protein
MPLQFPTCFKGSIMHAKRRIRPTCRCIGGYVFSYRKDYPLFSSLSFHLRVGPTRHDYLQPPAAPAPGRQCSRVPKNNHPPPASATLKPGLARHDTCPRSGTATPSVLIPPSTHREATRRQRPSIPVRQRNR